MTNPPPPNPASSIVTFPEREERNASFYVGLLTTRVLLKLNPELRLNPVQLEYSTHRVGEKTMEGLSLPAGFTLTEEQIERLAEEVSTLLKTKFERRRGRRQVESLNFRVVEDETAKAMQKGIKDLMETTERNDSGSRSCCAALTTLVSVVLFIISLYKLLKLFS